MKERIQITLQLQNVKMAMKTKNRPYRTSFRKINITLFPKKQLKI
jgi:hypothetical protein